jgi:hypothetical protein
MYTNQQNENGLALVRLEVLPTNRANGGRMLDIDLSNLSSAELTDLIQKAGMEFANRKEAGPPQPPEGPYYFSFGQPFAAGVTDGKFTLRIRSSFFGWVNFNWSLDAVQFLYKTIGDLIATGAITPSSVVPANIVDKTWAKH